ncbi:metal-dependent hydrolase [Halobaculum sp. P14]|uniref:metal-dependent hydrolase n=1 Tax=Halobaculum sp. P14 TaxID=3421638 RepID=UPI003EB949FE
MNKKGHVLNGALLAVGLGYILEPAGDVTTFVKIASLFVPLVLGALFPDVDTAFGRHRKTLHNLPVLGVTAAYPVVFDNLHFVWVGVATHYLLDLAGSKRGIALFYPLLDDEFDLPVGVPTSSGWADVVTVAITLVELGALAAVHFYVVDLNTAAAKTASFAAMV